MMTDKSKSQQERIAILERKVQELEMQANGAIGPFYEYTLEEWQRAYPRKPEPASGAGEAVNFKKENLP